MRVSVLAICCLALAAHSAAVGHERSLKQGRDIEHMSF